MKNTYVAVAVGGVFTVVGLEPAMAASALDTGMQTAVTTGLTTVVDTVKDLLTTGLALVITAGVLQMVPGMVKKLLHKAG